MIDTQPITRRRGDTYRIRVGFTQDDGTPLPLDGTFRLVVTEQSAPTELDAPVMELAGSIVGDLNDGIVDFQQSANEADNVGEFFYEVENTTSAGDIRTILEGPFTMIQDRAKTDEELIWTPPTEPADGTIATLDGSVDFLVVSNCYPDIGSSSRDLITYETRDGRRVIRCMVPQYNIWAFEHFLPYGPAFSSRRFFPAGWEFKVTGYINLATIQLYFLAGDGLSFLRCGLDSRDGTIAGECSATIVDRSTGGPKTCSPDLPLVPADGPGGWMAFGWFTVGVRILADGTGYFTYHPAEPHPEAMDDLWKLVDPTIKFHSLIFPSLPIPPSLMRAHPENASSVFDVWKYEWRRL